MELFEYECTQFAGTFRTGIVYDETENWKHRINCMIFICLILSEIWWWIRLNWMQNNDRKWSNAFVNNVIKIERKREKKSKLNERNPIKACCAIPTEILRFYASHFDNWIFGENSNLMFDIFFWTGSPLVPCLKNRIEWL